MAENQTQEAPATSKQFQEETINDVLGKITVFQTQGELRLPSNYSTENAVRSAWLIIQNVVDLNKRPALEVCTKASIATALLDMVLQGLNPVKKQCYFIVYGNQLTMSKSYIGTIAVAKRVANLKDAIGNVIYQGDVFEYEIDAKTGRKSVTKHEQKFENIDDDKIMGAWVAMEFNNGNFNTEIMTLVQIKKAWAQGKAKGTSPAHVNFPGEMAKKTVIQRGLKTEIGSSDDSGLFDEDERTVDNAVAEVVKTEINGNANKQSIKMPDQNKLTPPAPTVSVPNKEAEKQQAPATSQQPAQEVSEEPPY